MSYCQTFKQKIEEIKKKAKILENLLIEYKETGNEEIAKQFEREFERILQEIEEFKEEYEEKVKELLIKWYPKKEKLDEFIKSIKINEKGRVEIEELDVSLCELSDTFYLPSLFEEVKKLDCSLCGLTSLPTLPKGLEILRCSFNRLTLLPELPDELKELWCSHNKLTSLHELPRGLKKLYCSGNPLSPETIERIESHPNYDPRTWII